MGVVETGRLYRPDGEALSWVWAWLISLKLFQIYALVCLVFFFISLLAVHCDTLVQLGHIWTCN